MVPEHPADTHRPVPASHRFQRRLEEKRHALDLWGSYVERVAAGKAAPSNLVELAQTGR